MKKVLKIGGSVLLGVAVLTLFTLRLTGLEPGYINSRLEPEKWQATNMTARPGLWLKGEVVTTPVTNWDFANDIRDPIRGSTIQLETRTWYGISHSVSIGVVGRGDKLYVHAHSDPERMKTPFPYDKAWTTNVARDPRVRIKIAGKIYEVTLALMPDRAEVAAIWGTDPEEREKPDGPVTAVMHFYRVFQRNVPEYGSGAHMPQRPRR